MPPRRRKTIAPPLDVDALRTALAAGKLVRVGIVPSGQFPDGASGRVRRIGDPAVDGPEYLAVEVGSGSAKDVLPFAPSDLKPFSRSKIADVPEAPKPKPKPKPTPSPSPGPAAKPTPAAKPSTPISSRSDDMPKPPRIASRTDSPAPAPQQPALQKPSVPSVSPAPRSARGKRAPITITVSHDGSEGASWMVEARIGARVAVRPRPVPPSGVAEIARGLNDEKLTAVVEGHLAEHRRTVQARAEVLAAELAAVRAELDSYPSP